MSVSSIGSSASQLWQILRESRSQSDSGSSGTTSSTTNAAATNSASSLSSSGLSSADSKVVSDLKSLLIDLQSDTSASGGTSASSSSNGTSTSTSATGTDSSDLVKQLRGMFGELGKAGGHHHHHHSDSQASGQSGTQSGTGSLSNLTNGLNAYAQQLGLTSSSSSAATSVSV